MIVCIRYIKSLAFLLCIALPTQSFYTGMPVLKWVLVQGSSLKVNGSTNINTFTCEIANYSNPDTISVDINAGKNMGLIPMKGVLKLDILGFNCHNPMMTADLRKTLKAKNFPYMQIRFLNLNHLPEISGKAVAFKGMVDIALAGMNKQYEVNYDMYIDEQQTYHLIGHRLVTFSDFDLIPPRKLGGMIQAKDELAVSFHLYLKPLLGK